MRGRSPGFRGFTHLLAVVAVATFIIGVVAPGALMCQRVYPGRVPIDDDPARHGLTFEPIEFESLLDGTRLSGWYLPAPVPTGRAVVVVPGIDDNRLQSGITLRLAPALLEAGLDVLAIDLRGEGDSGPGPITFGAREQWDVLAAVDEARARGAARVGVLGFSLGAGSSILAASRSPAIDAVVADSAFVDLVEALDRELQRFYRVPAPLVPYALAWYRLWSGTDPSEVAPGSVIDDIAPRPILLIHGAADDTVAASNSERLLALAGYPGAGLWIVPGGEHARSFYANPAEYTKRVVGFFNGALVRR
jgi:alpha-beta hydrolase superfamily lysophospholipase